MDVDLEPLSSQDNVEDCMMTGVEENVNCTWDCGGSSSKCFWLRNATLISPYFMILQDKINNQIEDCFSCTSLNRESWGKCSSLGGNDQEPCADLRVDNLPQTIVDVFATSLRSMKEKCSEPKEDEQKLKKNKNKIKKKKKKKGETADKK
ncbi:hypothetical protein S83_034840 [Arachis hypogaea]